jgi:hypothetical protein
MFQQADEYRLAARERELPPRHGPEEAARLALTRVRKVLTGFLPGMLFDPERLRSVLDQPLPRGPLEAERLHALGFLHWLADDLPAAETHLQQAVAGAPPDNLDLLGAAAYWRARVRLLLERPEAVPEFEAVLRNLKGSPQATAWFVDLLWRGGRIDRAEQVWKSVRANKRVTACDEGPFLEARSIVRRGELAAAERTLYEAAPGSGVLQTERLLLLAWVATTLKQPQRAAPLLKQAQALPYRAGTVAQWQRLLEGRGQGADLVALAGPLSPLLRDLALGHQARLAGQVEEAAAAYQKARAVAAAEPFARHALACLGHDDHAAVLAGQPGLFLALRCRVWQALERFRRREATPAEFFEVVQQASAAGFQDPAADHFRQLPLVLQRRDPSLSDLQGLFLPAGENATALPPAQRRNLFRAALEVGLRRLPPEGVREMLLGWSRLEFLAGEPELRGLLARPLLRLVLREKLGPGAEREALERLLPGDPLLALLHPDAPGEDSPQAHPALRLLHAGRHRPPSGAEAETWRERVRRLCDPGRWQALAQALLLQEAARRGDLTAASALLEEVDAWRGFRGALPRFILKAVASLVSAQPAHPAWKRSLPPWLALWDPASLGPEGKTLAAQAGLTAGPAHLSEPPPGTPAAPWFLHLAARALTRDDAGEALACVRRALDADPELTGVPDPSVVREALPALERRALAQALAAACGTASGSQLVDLVDLLRDLPEGSALLEAARRGDAAEVREGLAALAQRPDLPPRLLHHLALVELRTAQAGEDRDQGDEAAEHWRLAWQSWLRFLATAPDLPAGAAVLVLDGMLGLHRRRVNDLLARNEVDRARRHWALVQELPAAAARQGEALGKELADRVARFRDELATEYLVTTREAMRHGDIAEGMHADYEKGLGYLRRLLSLDRENLRLLTAMVEVCGEYFLDLYHAGEPASLGEQVERYTPFALQLARLSEGRSGDLAALAALSEFYKFRGFVTRDREQKVALYRDALRFNPANDNVRSLLDDLEGTTPE